MQNPEHEHRSAGGRSPIGARGEATSSEFQLMTYPCYVGVDGCVWRIERVRCGFVKRRAAEEKRRRCATDAARVWPSARLACGLCRSLQEASGFIIARGAELSWVVDTCIGRSRAARRTVGGDDAIGAEGARWLGCAASFKGAFERKHGVRARW